MTLVYLGTALWAVWIINHLCHRFADWVHRPHTPTDDYCSSLDQEWDELEARRAIRPHGNCDVIPFPDIPRHRGGRGPCSLQLHDDDPDGAA